jgi:hypothetical protein
MARFSNVITPVPVTAWHLAACPQAPMPQDMAARVVRPPRPHRQTAWRRIAAGTRGAEAGIAASSLRAIGVTRGWTHVWTEAYAARLLSITSLNAVEEMTMDQSYVAENAVERARLQAIVARLTDADMARAMSEQWTIGVGLMHLAFWDRLSWSKFEE